LTIFAVKSFYAVELQKPLTAKGAKNIREGREDHFCHDTGEIVGTRIHHRFFRRTGPHGGATSG
jgi:hypothetical protein